MHTSWFDEPPIFAGETKHPENIVIALHGMTSNHECLHRTIQPLLSRIPGTLVVLPNAPIRMKMHKDDIERTKQKFPDFNPEKARSWFDIGKIHWPKMLLQTHFNVMPSVGVVHGMTLGVMERFGLPENKVGYFGMSAGGIIALYSALRLPKPPACVCVHSSMFFGCGTKIKEPLEAIMITGDQDEYTMKAHSRINAFFQSHKRAKALLERSGVCVQERIIPGLDHRTTPETIEQALNSIMHRLHVPFLNEKAQAQLEFSSPLAQPA